MGTSRSSVRVRVALIYLCLAGTLLPIMDLLYQISSEGANAQLAGASAVTQAACDEIRQKFTLAFEQKTFGPQDEGKFQDALLEIILERYDGVEGGFWNQERGFIGYAFPTYDGEGPKKDVPRSEMPSLAALAAKTIETGSSQTHVHRGRREAVYSHACPVVGANDRTAAWVLYRAPVASGTAFDRLGWIVWALLGLVVLTGLGAVWILRQWSRDLARAREESEAIARKLGQADRLTFLGRMAAGIAHEIRNPLATIKLKLENAQVNPAERFPAALPVVNDQIARVDRLVQMLLAMARPFALHPEDVKLGAWFASSFPAVLSHAETRGVSVVFDPRIESWRFDAFHFARALENVLRNAVDFSPPGESVAVRAFTESDRLVIEVKDHGPGLVPEVRDQLFQPFVSKREDGTGLGLVLAKEIVEAHGGRLTEVGDATGACFRMEVPWPKS